MSSIKRVAVVLGLGTGAGTGAAAARAFAKEGYSIALIARRGDALRALETSLVQETGVEAASFEIKSYKPPEFVAAFESIRSRFPRPTYEIRVAIFNGGNAAWKKFLEITPEDVSSTVSETLESAFAFSREIILDFEKNEIDEIGKRGALIFTGATSSIRGNIVTSAFSAAKHGLRALSQSLSKEFGQKNIHVSHAIIDGPIITATTKARKNDPEWDANPDVRLEPASIAASYVYLAKQDRSAWTWELDLRPAHEQWTW